MRTRDDVRTDEFADFAGGLRAGVHRGLDAADVALGDHRDQAAADLDGFYQCHVRGLDHGVAGLDAAGVALRFDHSYRFAHNLFWLIVVVEIISPVPPACSAASCTRCPRPCQCGLPA